MNHFAKKQLLVLWLAATAVILFWSASPPPTHAAIITVTTATDELDGLAGNNFCSLREAIRNANLNSSGQIDCTAGTVGADVIIFAPALDGIPITLSIANAGENNNLTGDLDIRDVLTITGNGPGRTIIDANGIDRAFHIPVATTATFENITIRNGFLGTGNGGGILNGGSGTLTINNSVISGNTTNDMGVGASAGGIFNNGTLTINNSTIRDNAALGSFASGGGLSSFGGTTTMTNVTISNNRAYGDGGGILLVIGTMTMTNVTITANVADDDSMFNENGGGMAQSGSGSFATFNNVIIADNEDRSGTTQDDCIFGPTSTVTSNGYNLRYVGTGCDGRLNNANDITSTPATIGLGPLQDNGGPTPTHDLLVGSDAIDQVPATVNGCTTTVTADQRGVPRADGLSTGTLCDVGAVEYVGPTQPSATNGGDGPGGVGLTDGTSSLTLWLDAAQGTYTNNACTSQAANGNPLGCWADKSGNGLDVTQAIGSEQPLYQTGSLNNQPVLTFDATDYLTRTVQGSDLFGSDQATILFTKRSTGGAVWFSWQSVEPSNRVGFELGSGDVTRFDMPNDSGGTLTGTASISNTYHIIAGDKSPTTQQIFLDGSLDASRANTLTLTTTVSAPLVVGKYQGGGLGWTGDMAEVIVYDTSLTSVQRVLVENYLSSKFDLSIAGGGEDHYDGDTNANGDFDLNVAGIGQLAGNQHTQAHGVGMIVRDRSFLQDDGDWLLFGHRTAVNTNTIVNVPTTGDWTTAPDPRRWERHWFIDVTDAAGTTGGTVDIIFDFGEGSMAGQLPSAPVSNYRLLKRTLDTGDFTDVAIATAVVGDQVQFLNVDVALLGSNFTLGTLDFTNSPTAVTLQNFTAVSPVVVPLLVVALTLLLGLVSLGVVIRKR